jgi:uncharacterized protein YcfL
MIKTFFPMIGLMALLAGCSDVPPYHEGRSEIYTPPQVQITGLDAENLRWSTVVDRPMTHRDESNLLFVTVPVRNTTWIALHVQYRYNFLDDQGRPLAPNIAWNRKTLEPGATERITFNSTTPQAAYFQLEIRYAR